MALELSMKDYLDIYVPFKFHDHSSFYKVRRKIRRKHACSTALVSSSHEILDKVVSDVILSKQHTTKVLMFCSFALLLFACFS